MSDANVTRLNTPKHIYTAGFLLALKHQHFLSFETLAFVQRNIDKIFEMRVKHLEVNFKFALNLRHIECFHVMLIFRLFQEKLALLVPSSIKTKPEYQRAIAKKSRP